MNEQWKLGNKEAWSEYCIKRKLLKEKIGEKRRILSLTCKVLMKVREK